jgi:DNA polymerase-3 subunit epsilon
MEEIDQLRSQLELARAWGAFCFARAFPEKSPPVEVPTRREGCDARAACGGTDPSRPFSEVAYVVLDVETSGLDPHVDRVVEIAFVLVDEDGDPVTGITRSWSTLVNPGVAVPPVVGMVHKITDGELASAPTFAEAWAAARDLRVLPGPDAMPLAFNAPFDRDFVCAELVRAGLMHEAQAYADTEWIDPLVVVRDVDKYAKGKKLADACARRKIVIDGAHRALADAIAAHRLFQQIVPRTWLHGKLADVLRAQRDRRIAQDEELAAFLARNGRGRAA